MATITANTGSNNWNTNGAWVGAVQPTAADDVVIPASAIVTVPTTTTVQGRSCTVQASGTLIFSTSSSILNIGDATAGAGNVALSVSATATLTFSGAAIINLISTSATVQTISTNGKNLANLVVNGAGSSYQVTSSFTVGSGNTLTLTNGTLDTNGSTCSWGFVAFGTGTKTLTLGASNITLTGTSGTVWASTTSNTTLNANTSSISCASNGITFAGNGKTYNNLTLSGNGTCTISGANTFNNLTRTSSAGNGGGLVFQADHTINGIFTVTGTYSATNAGRFVVAPSIFTNASATRTITVNGSFSFTNVDFHVITAAGTAGTWTGTSMGDGSGNSNITFDVSRTLFWVGTAGNWTTLNRWSLSTGGASASTAPLPQDDCFIDVNSGITASNTFTTGLRFMGRNIDFTGVPNAATLSFNFGAFNPGITGSITLASGMTMTNSGAAATCNILCSADRTIRSNGVTWNNGAGTIGITIATFSSSKVILGDDLTLSGGLTFSGSFDANNKNVNVTAVTSGISLTRTITMGSGTWTLSGTGTIWSFSGTGLTFNANTSTIVISDASVTSKTFAGFSLTYNNVSVTGGGSGSVTFSNNSTWNTMTLNAPKTIIFQSASTQTVTNFIATGSAGNIIAISASTGASAANLSKASGIVSCDYLSLTDSNATGGASWYAGANSTNVSNNTGWLFQAPSGGNNMLLMGV